MKTIPFRRRSFETIPFLSWPARLALAGALWALGALGSPARAGTYGGGAGTAGDPYRIGSTVDWQELMVGTNDWGGHFLQTADLDFGGAALTPVGVIEVPFTGVFDGNGHALRNAAIDAPVDYSYLGVFGTVASGQLCRVTTENVAVSGRGYVGGLVGFMSYGLITNCHVGGASGTDWTIGGLAGVADFSTIASCSATGSVTGSGQVGGLVGRMQGGRIVDSHATGGATGQNNLVGGLAGTLIGSEIADSYATGDVGGAHNVGGLVGYAQSSTLSNTYATGTVTSHEGTMYSGGLVGFLQDGAIANSRAAGAVGGGSNFVGGLVGYVTRGTITVCRAEGSVAGFSQVGGLVGHVDYGAIADSSATGTVQGADMYVGGLAGFMDSASIANSHATGPVQSTSGYAGGLAGYVYNGAIANSYAMGTVAGTNYGVGGLVGQVYSSTITGCRAEGSVQGSEAVGGLVGQQGGGAIADSLARGDVVGVAPDEYDFARVGGLAGLADGQITGCRAEGAVRGNKDGVGGLVGLYMSGTIADSSATGEVVGGHNRVGGLAGFVVGGNVVRSYATGDVTGGDWVGGLVGQFSGYSDIQILDAYATGAVRGNVAVGGLVGYCDNQILNSYATGAVSGTADVGGLVGTNYTGSPVVASYWDVQTTGQAESGGGSARRTVEMAYPSAANTYAGWDFAGTWVKDSEGRNGGYPYLGWQTFAPATPGLLISAGSVNVREAGQGRFFVRLATLPAGDVAVAVERSAGSESLAVQSGATLTFTRSNWRGWQAVTLAAPADENDENETATFRISAAGLEDQFIQATALDDDGIGENVALASGGATITGAQAGRAAQSIDGVHAASTNYAYIVWTNNPPGSLTVDLNVPATVSWVRLLLYDWACRDQSYRLETSLDGTTWVQLAESNEDDSAGWDNWSAGLATFRYLRFTGLSSTASQLVLVSEMEIYGTRDYSGLPQPAISQTSVNVREGGEGRFYIRLAEVPERSVTFTVERVSGSADISIQSGATRAFSANTWNTWQAVTLAAAKDENAVSEEATFRISAEGLDDRFVTATTLDDDIGENLALGASGSTISGVKASRPGLLIDGVHTDSLNYGHTWWTNVPPGTMTLDMKNTATVSRVRLLNFHWTHRVHRYTIESSTDGVNWSMLADASGEDRQGWDDWPVADVAVRYLKFTGLSNSANQSVAIAELEVYGTRPEIDVALPVFSKASVNVREGGRGTFFMRLDREPRSSVVFTVSRILGDESIVITAGATRVFEPSNWDVWQPVVLGQAKDDNDVGEEAVFRISAAGRPDYFMPAIALDEDIGENLALASSGATITGVKASRPWMLIDGIHTASGNYGHTMWTATPPGTMTLDLGGDKVVSRVRILNWDWTYRVHRYTIESSTDGVNWTMLADASEEDRQGWDDWEVDNQTIRYLKFTGLSNSENQSVVIPELEVYGTPPPPPEGQGKAWAMSLESIPVSVLTSDGPEDPTGWLAVDGDPKTAWVGQKAGGGYLVIEYAPALTLGVLEVGLGESSLTNVDYLYSRDAEEWLALPEGMETNPVTLNFLWVVFPDDGTDAVPKVLEIRPNP